MNLTKALQHSPDFKAAYETEDVTKELVNTALILEDLTRNASVHAAGVVIADEPLANLLPLKLAEDGSIVTQYAMGPVGELGLLKMDFLGLKTLSVIRNACDMIRATRGVEVPIDQLPLDDAPTYELLNKANTLGVFQLESSGMRDLCRKFQIGSLEHITALIALYRPGPMELIPEFIRRRQGEVQIVYEHPLLEPICGETYGIMVYQEQVMQAAQVLAGYTLGAADILRRAMGKKKAEEMAAQRETFVVGCAAANDIPPEKAHQIFNLLEKFAGYGFNKSHAAAYAVVAYQTAYLKANYPIEFFCAMMTNDMGDTDKLSLYVAEARSSGIDVLPPDVNESGPHFAPSRERPAIRFGLAAVKNLGEAAVEAIVRGRTAGGPFASLADFCARVDAKALNRKVLETLIRCGACDGLGENRATLTANLEGALARGSSIALDRARGQGSLFGFGPGAALQVEPSPIRKPEWPESELLAGEKELLGFYVTGHPLTRYAALLETYSLATTATLAELPSRSMTRIGGLIAAVQGGVSKKTNKPYAMVTLEDLHGSVAVLFVNEAYDTHRELLVPKTAVIVTGEVNRSEDKPKLFPVEVAPLEQAPRLFTQQVHFRLNSAHLNRERLMAARDLALAHRGTCPLFLCVMLPAGQAVFLEAHEQFAVTPSLELERAADQAFGQGTYYAKVDTTLPARATRRWERREGPPPAGEPDPGEAPTP
jgi:DNA polymerase-3 subunit alpha